MAKIDRNILIYGGQYEIYNKKATKFFKTLLECNAKLVFFCRPFLNDGNDKIIEKVYDHAVRSEESLAVFKENQRKFGNVFPWHQDKRFLYNLMQICSDYGEIHIHHNGFTFHIVQYARDHRDEVLAMIQYDTDFLLFDAEYQYWNLADLDMVELTTKLYCRERLLIERLQLNCEKQYQMLAALSRLGSHTVNNFVRTVKTEETNGATIFKLADYVRQVEDLDALDRIAIDFFGENYQIEQLKEIQDGLSRYEMPQPDQLDGYSQNFRDLVEFFLEKNLYFAYGLAVETVSTNQALSYIDMRQEDSPMFVDLMTTILMKQCGIVLKDMEERPPSRAIKIGQRNSDEHMQAIIYPPRKLKLYSHFNWMSNLK